MPAPILPLILKILNLIWKVLKIIIECILILLMVIATPFIYLILENIHIKFNSYKNGKKKPFFIRWFNNIIYIAWGLIGVIFIYFIHFSYTNLKVYIYEIFCFDYTNYTQTVLIFLTISVSLIYYSILITLNKKIYNRYYLGGINWFNLFIKLTFIIFFITFLSLPEYSLQFYHNAHTLNEKNYIDNSTNTFQLDFDYLKIIIKNTFIYGSSFFIKIILLTIDSKYAISKEKELKSIY